MNWLSVVVGKVPELVTGYFTKRMELKAAERAREEQYKDAIHQRRIDLVKAGLTADLNWEMEFAEQARTSWKDEYTLGVVSLPAVMCFVKTSTFNGPAIVSEGFRALGTTPVWFQVILCIMFCATVGVRWWRRTQSDTQ